MTAYFIRRLWQMIPTLAGVILLIFFLFKVTFNVIFVVVVLVNGCWTTGSFRPL